MPSQQPGRVRGNLGFALPPPCSPKEIWRQIGAACGYGTARPRLLPDHDGMDEGGGGAGAVGLLCTAQRWVALGVARPGDRAAVRGHSGGPRAGIPFILRTKAPHQFSLFFGAPWNGAAGTGVWDASEQAGLQPAMDFPTLGVPREGEEGSRQQARIASQGLPVIPFLARESLG